MPLCDARPPSPTATPAHSFMTPPPAGARWEERSLSSFFPKRETEAGRDKRPPAVFSQLTIGGTPTPGLEVRGWQGLHKFFLSAVSTSILDNDGGVSVELLAFRRMTTGDLSIPAPPTMSINK